jgi:hypothetical protein
MAFDWLKPKPLTRITTAWGTALIDVLNLLYGWITDGTKNISINELLANYGYINWNLFVQGKPVIKDGDPISLYDISDYAQSKITTAIASALARFYFDEYGRVGVAIYDDKVGLAKDATLSALGGKLDAIQGMLQEVLGILRQQDLRCYDATIDTLFAVPEGTSWYVRNVYVVDGEMYVDGEVKVCG